MNTPKLRFKGFTDSWETKKIKDIATVNQGLQIPISERFYENGNNRFFYITNEFLKPSSKVKYFIENPPNSVLCNEEDILMTRTGNTGQVVSNVSGAFHNNFFKINYNKSLISRDFLTNFLKLKTNQHIIMTFAGQSTIPDLNHSDFYKIKISYPNLKEQEKIGLFANEFERRIKLQQEKISLLREQKKGYMQKIFSQELRFKNEKGKPFPDWENKTLGEITEIIGGGTPSTDNQEFWVEEVPWFTPSEIGKNKYVSKSNRMISHKGLQKSTAKLLPKGTVLLTTRASLGDMAILKVEASTNQGFQSLMPLDNTSSEFIYYLQPLIKKHCYLKASGSTFLEISKHNLKAMRLKLPSKDEQDKIVAFLSGLDRKIVQEQNILYLLNIQKQAFMQQMFI